jgi:hypothetical protein
MNVVDKVQLDLFLAEIRRARVLARDRQADEAIRCALEGRSDALYLLVQRVFQLQSALCESQAQVAEPNWSKVNGACFATDVTCHDDDPWWRQPPSGASRTIFLFQSAKYLFRNGADGDEVHVKDRLVVDAARDEPVESASELSRSRSSQ